jgi:hypothetical protein
MWIGKQAASSGAVEREIIINQKIICRSLQTDCSNIDGGSPVLTMICPNQFIHQKYLELRR